MKQEKKTVRHRILLIEDNPDDIVLTQEALAETDFDVVLDCARDGIEGITYLKNALLPAGAGLPDLVLLDLNLPRCSGIEFLREMKTDNMLKSVPVIVLTTSRARDDISRSYGNYANSYIVKPVDMNEFIELIRAVTFYWFRISVLPGGQI
ncbi:MAG: response regulator [Spirochaetota bacterium]